MAHTILAGDLLLVPTSHFSKCADRRERRLAERVDAPPLTYPEYATCITRWAKPVGLVASLNELAHAIRSYTQTGGHLSFVLMEKNPCMGTGRPCMKARVYMHT